MAQGSNYEIWTSFVEAKYLIDAKTYVGKCPTCNSTRDCNNYYCLQCKLGGLCPMTFRGNGAHTCHRWLQVRRQSRMSAVDPEDLGKYLPRESTKHIQKCLLNTGSVCYLRTDHRQASRSASSRPPARRDPTGNGQPSPLQSGLKSCEACNKAIAKSQDCKEDFLLCSVECLITLAQRQPERNLLRMPDGALAPTDEFPWTAVEKIKGRLMSSSSGSSSKPLAVIDDRAGSSSRGETVAEPEPPVAVRGPSGRRTPVNYRELHQGGAIPGRGIAAAAAAGTRAGATDAAAETQESHGGSSQRGPANRTQAAPDYSAYPRELQSSGFHYLIEAAKINRDRHRYLGNRGRD